MGRRRHESLTDATELLQQQFGALGGGFGKVVAAWRTAAGEQLAQVSMPTRLADGDLRVRCADSAWASEVLHQAPVLLRRLQRELGSAAPTKITPRAGRMPDPRPATPPVPPPQLPPLDARASASIRATVEALPEGDVRASVEQAMRRSRQLRAAPPHS